jgi:hypothetical protein
VLLGEAIASQDTPRTAVSATGLLLCLAFLGATLFRKVCFLNSALSSTEFWRYYP